MKKTAKPNLVVLMIFLVALGLWGTSEGTNRRCITQEWWWGRTNKKDIAFDGLNGAVSLYTHTKNVFAQLCYVNVIFDRSWALKGAPGVTGRWCSILGGGKGGGWIRTTTYIMILGGSSPLYPWKKMTMPNLLISMAFLVALGLLGGPWGDGWVIW